MKHKAAAPLDLPNTPGGEGHTHFASMHTSTAAGGAARPTIIDAQERARTMTSAPEKSSSSRVFFLRLADSRKWHYSDAFGISFDFFIQVLAVAFSSKERIVGTYFSGEIEAEASRFFCSGMMVSYVVDMLFRLCGLRSALFRSKSNIADVLCVLAMGGCVGGRWVLEKYEYDLTLGYICLLSLRLILKPRARKFSKKLHKFRTNGDQIRISIESLRASLARIPGITALSIEMMETDLLIICGRDSGDMSRQELMSFLERALRHRPPTLSSTEFLAHLREIDATSSQSSYSIGDVVKSTLSHWSNQFADLVLSMIVVCINASITPLMSLFLTLLSDAFYSQNKQRIEWEDDKYKIGFMGLLILIVPFVLGDYAIGFFQSKMIAKATERIQNNLLATILRQNTNFFAERSEGDLNNLFSSDVARVNSLWQAVFWNLLNPLVSVAFGLGYAMYMRYPIGIMAMAFAAALMSSGPQGYASLRSKEFASKNAYVASDFQNSVGCNKVVRAYRIQTPVMQRFEKMTLMLREAQFKKDFWSSLVQIYIESAMYFFTALLITAMATKVWHREDKRYPNDWIRTGEFFGFVTLLQRVSNPVTVLGGFMRVAIGNASSLQRVDDIVVGLAASNPDNGSDRDLPSLPTMQKDLRIEKLVFKYDKSSENYVLKELSATIPRGSYTCIVGPSGCGKSTLLALLMQFQEADGGCIRLDGHDIFNFSKASFMSQTAVVFQDGGILNGTIYDNIRYGNMSATDRDCEEAARLAECHFISELKDGFETIVGQHATANLSGGQSQRLCLARALCRKPSVLLLDEATSALDPETEASIIATLERLSGKMNMTILSVTHRLATTEHANQILVMNQGRIAESGTHAELVRKGGLFAEMLHRSEESDEEEDLPLPRKKTSVGSRHMSVEDRRGEMGGAQSIVALQDFTRILSTRAENRSRQMSNDSFANARAANNTSFLDGGRRAAASSASQTSEDERNKYFVL